MTKLNLEFIIPGIFPITISIMHLLFLSPMLLHFLRMSWNLWRIFVCILFILALASWCLRSSTLMLDIGSSWWSEERTFRDFFVIFIVHYSFSQYFCIFLNEINLALNHLLILFYFDDILIDFIHHFYFFLYLVYFSIQLDFQLPEDFFNWKFNFWGQGLFLPNELQLLLWNEDLYFTYLLFNPWCINQFHFESFESFQLFLLEVEFKYKSY